MNPPDDSADPRVKVELEQLRPTALRDPRAEARGRAAFLAQAQLLSRGVSARPIRRHIGQIHFFSGKEMSPMTTLATIILVIALVVGGTGGAAVYAAQDDLPTETLYGVKLLSEDTRLGLTADPAARADLLLEFAQRRVQEITALSAQSTPPLEPVAARLRAEVDAALQLAAGADDATLNRILAQIQAQLENELRLMAQAQAGASGEAAPILEQVRAMLQERQQLCQTGLTDPQAFRDQIRDQTHDQDRLQTGTPQRGPDPNRTPEPTGTALGPGPVNTPADPGAANTPAGPGPVNTPAGPGLENTPAGSGSANTPAGSGAANTPAGSGAANTPAGSGAANTPAGPGAQSTTQPGGRP